MIALGSVKESGSEISATTPSDRYTTTCNLLFLIPQQISITIRDWVEVKVG